MGRSIAIKFTVQLFVPGVYQTPSEWRTRSRLDGRLPAHGKPTTANLAAYVRKFEDSTRSGGCNEHLGFQKVARAEIIDQELSKVVATYAAS